MKRNYVVSRGNTTQYIRYRVLRPVLKIYYSLFNLFNPSKPWTTPASIRIFEQLLTREMTGLEYGSGRSTIFFASRLKKLVSIEHYATWYTKVEQMLSSAKISNVEYLLIPKNNANELDDNTDEYHGQFTGNEVRAEYADYANKVLEFPDEHFDFILIDGRSRVNCGLNAILKLKSGGIFVLDNSERPRYHRLHLALSDWPRVNTTTGLTDTTIWFKP